MVLKLVTHSQNHLGSVLNNRDALNLSQSHHSKSLTVESKPQGGRRAQAGLRRLWHVDSGQGALYHCQRPGSGADEGVGSTTTQGILLSEANEPRNEVEQRPF